MRAFYEIPDDDPSQITAKVAAWTMASRENLTPSHWEVLYTGINTINKKYNPRWANIKPQVFKFGGADCPVEQVLGMTGPPTYCL